MRQGDTSPTLEAVLRNGDGSFPNLTGATVVVYMVDRSGVIIIDGKAATVTDVDSATVEYEWDPADTAEHGVFHLWFKVTFASGKVGTYPNEGTKLIRIDPAA